MKRIVRRHLRRTALVTLKSSETFEGVLFEADREAFVLRNCQIVDANDRGLVPVDGELVVLRADVAYMQFV